MLADRSTCGPAERLARDGAGHQALDEELLEVEEDEAWPLVAPGAAVNLLGGPDLVPGAAMPDDGPAFRIWRAARR